MKQITEDIIPFVQELLEQYAFLFSDPIASKEAPSDVGPSFEVYVDYTGASNGRMRLLGPQELAEEIALNTLGVDDVDELETEDVDDVLKELMNVLAGQLISELAVEGELFKLAPPVLERDEQGGSWATRLGSMTTWTFLVEDMPVQIVLQVA